MHRDAVEIVLECFPRIFHACHVRHVRDPRTREKLSAHQASILDHLDARRPTHLHELARHLGVTPSTMSLTVDRLKRNGYVHRSRDRADARRVNLRLTPAGLRIKRQQKVLDDARVRELLERLSPEERVSAIAGLQALARAAGEMLADRPGRRRSSPTDTKR